MNHGDLNTENVQKALADYFYLIDRGYPEKGALKLTGDRYRLSSDLRTLLYRGITSQENSEKRRARLIDKPEGLLIIDGYNVLFTLLNYRLGRLVFISVDNICRDNGSLFGKIMNEDLFTDCTGFIVEYLSTLKDLEVCVYFDEPVSFSRNHKHILLHELNKAGIHANVKVVHSADQSILMHSEGVIATSDSNILDHSENALFDLPRKILESKFNATLYNLYDRFIAGTIR